MYPHAPSMQHGQRGEKAIMQSRASKRNILLSFSICASLVLLGQAILGVADYQRDPYPPCRPHSVLPPSDVPNMPPCTGSWFTFGFDISRSGVNPEETVITPTTVGQLHRLWVHHLPQVADTAPILLPRLILPDGAYHDVLYLTTKQGSLVALDAKNGTQLWMRTPYIPTDPNKFTTSAPIGDLAQEVVYSYGMDGKVHQYRATSGQEIRGNGWPVQITTMKDSEKESSSLNAADGYLYVTTASFGGDAPPYQGHLVTINLTRHTTRVFNSICSTAKHLLAPGECKENYGGIWARAGTVIDPLTGNLFLAIGNGPFTANLGGDDWGESVLELTSDGTRVIDSYTPKEPDALSEQDQDLGSSAPALLPIVSGSATPSLAVQAGKEGVLRLLNRQNLSGKGGPGHIGGALQTIDAPGHCPVLTQPVVWTEPDNGQIWVFVSDGCKIGGYQVVTSRLGMTTLREVWSASDSATSPIVAGGVLFASTIYNGVVALDPKSGRQLWSSAQSTAKGTIGSTHWESPIVVGGRLYCSDEQGNVSAYGL